MSKNLIKILSICAAIIILPLVILGAIVLSTQATGVVIKVVEAGNEGGVGTSSRVSVFVDDEEQEKTTITVKKNSDIKVVYEENESVGYDWDGWYVGGPNENGTKATTAYVYTFTARANTTVTALRNVKTYVITYSAGVAEDKNGLTYKYGYQLENPTNTDNDGATFVGWRSTKVGEDSTPVTSATFIQSGAHELDAVWSNQMKIEYFRQGATQPMATDFLTNEQIANYTLRNAEDEQIVIQKGYEFGGWTLGGNPITSISQYDENGYKLYLVENTINYTLNVQYNAKDNSEGNKQQVSFNVVDKLGEYTKTRDGYTFVGFKCGNTIYNASTTNFDGLIDAADVDNKIDVVAVWTCDYSEDFSFNLAIQAIEKTAPLTGMAIYVDNTHSNDKKAIIDGTDVSNTIYFSDTDEFGYTLENNVIEDYYKALLNAQYNNWNGKFYNNEGAEVEWNFKFILTVDGTTINITFNTSSADSLTFNYLMLGLTDEEDGFSLDELNGKTVTVMLQFVEKN